VCVCVICILNYVIRKLRTCKREPGAIFGAIFRNRDQDIFAEALRYIENRWLKRF